MQKILIELILTNQCNKRCNYCDLEFKNKSLSFSDLDLFINFIKNNPANYTINFFWGEPLLEFNKLKYFLNNSKKYINKLSIWTNGLLLDEEKLKYFKENNVKIYLSIDNIINTAGQQRALALWNSKQKNSSSLNTALLSKYSDIININFINDPDFLSNSINTFEKIKKNKFKNIAFMPVFSTKKRDKNNLIKLKEIYNHILKNSSEINLKTYKYLNQVSIDKQFILDTDLNFYSDLDSLLWLQKQYKNIPKNLKQEIESKTKLLSLKDANISLNKLINKYNIKEILELVFKIPKESGDLVNHKIIDKILI